MRQKYFLGFLILAGIVSDVPAGFFHKFFQKLLEDFMTELNSIGEIPEKKKNKKQFLKLFLEKLLVKFLGEKIKKTSLILRKKEEGKKGLNNFWRDSL